MPLTGNEAVPPYPFPELEKRYDCIVVGAGIVGAPLAATLGKQGRRVLLIERDMKEPDRIVGELMQPGGVDALTKLGLAWTLEDIDAAGCAGYAVINGKEDVVLRYPQEEAKEVKGWSFHHGRFISQLRKAAAMEKNVTILEATASSLLTESGKVVGVTCSFKDSEKSLEVHAPMTFIADGCFSKFRRDLIDRPIEVPGHFVGLVLEDADLPHPGFGHVVLANPSPILLYQISTHHTRILVDIPGPKLPSAANGDLARYMKDFVCPQLPETVRPSFEKAIEEDRLRSMPNQYLPPTANTTPGLFLLGDAMNMRHPLTGGGMTVGLADVVLLSEALEGVDFEDAEEVLKRCKSLHWKRKNLSGVVNVLSLALYRLFSAGNDENMLALRQACFAYFTLGGRFVSEPIRLLGCILPSPLTLLMHFFAVALYAGYQITKSGGVWKAPWNLVKAVIVLWEAARVILPLVGMEMEGKGMKRLDGVGERWSLRRVAVGGAGVVLAAAVARHLMKRR